VRALFFYAAAARPGDAQAILHQTDKTLRPFNRFLRQAIHTAKQRQFRYQLPWERVGGLQEIDLRPVDRRVFVPRRRPAWVIANWPQHLEPDPAQGMMVVNRSLTVNVVEYLHVARGLRFRSDEALYDDDQVWWCGRQCAIVPEPTPPAPSVVEDGTGARLRLLRSPQPDEDGWVLLVEGWSGDGDLVVDGERVTPQALPAQEGVRRLRDGEGRSFELTGGTLKVEDLPADGLLTGDNGVRFTWKAKRTARRAGAWVQLLPAENEDSEDFLDPRAAFCEGEVQEVWTQTRHSKKTAFTVRKVDPERYQLQLDQLPPRGTSLFLPVNIHTLQLQRRALRQLTEAPLPHHQGLLRLCENPKRVQWPRFCDMLPDHWTTLIDHTRSGTGEQQEFVAKALGSPDIIIMEGPPGSGKTTAICELIQQLAARGKRVLLCSSTHAAIDNVLEKLLEASAPVDAVRIGRVERVDEKLQEMQIDHKVEKLVQTWRTAPHLRVLGDDDLKDMAERTVVTAANLTCGTTMGIVRHPVFRERDAGRRHSEQPITTMPHWDVLIIDEASKTLIQEFLVPGLMAKRWVVVGDVQQLPPFTDRADIVANLRSLVDEHEHDLFAADHQRACLLRFWMVRQARRVAGARWLVVEPPGVLDWLGEELRKRQDVPQPIARVVARTATPQGPFHEVSVEQVQAGDPAALLLTVCDWVLVADDLLAGITDHLPADLLHHRDLTRHKHKLPESHPLLFRHAWSLAQLGRLPASYTEHRRDSVTTFAQAEASQQRWLIEHDLATEIAWRLTRHHELRRAHNQRDRERLLHDLRQLQPVATDISEPIAEIQDIGLPSILEVLQEGIGADRTTRRSALTEGMPRGQRDAFHARFVSLSYQHRMHPDISDFSRELIYGGNALKDANTIGARDQEINWSFVPFRGRRVWIDVHGREHERVNADEIAVMKGIVRAFLSWAEKIGAPQRNSPKRWEVACLCFYQKQEKAISDELRQVSGDDRRNRFTVGNVELVCATVDRFQGREADLVLLSMRNTRRVGFLDSPNRLNVAVTRARQQLVVIGKASTFARCGITELEELVKRSPREDAQRWSKRRR
jgi:AAA domain-containing protein